MNIVKLLLLFLAIALVGVVSYVGLTSFKRYTDIIAINSCTSEYRQQIVKNESTTVIRPLEQQARECSVQKGVTTWNGVWSDLISN